VNEAEIVLAGSRSLQTLPLEERRDPAGPPASAGAGSMVPAPTGSSKSDAPRAAAGSEEKKP
jgi:hypothetical protein